VAAAYNPRAAGPPNSNPIAGGNRAPAYNAGVKGIEKGVNSVLTRRGKLM
jgi:hypothetical protein